MVQFGKEHWITNSKFFSALILDYIPPETIRDGPNDPEIPVPPLPEELPPDIDDGLAGSLESGLETPNRGPQSPLNLKDKPYVSPPPRPGGALGDIEEVLNSQITRPATRAKDPYIPPKTKVRLNLKQCFLTFEYSYKGST